MPPRIRTLAAAPLRSPTASILPSFLLPFLTTTVHSQSRSASILASLSDTKGAYNKKIRRGRGPSSGKGKTAGRGASGQKKHGGVPFRFQGGQTSTDVEHGRAGFKNIHAIEMSHVNLDIIQEWINQGRLDPKKPITLRELTSTRAIHGIKDGVKLLARGATALTSPVHLVVSRASESAIAAVEALGGTVTTRFYTPQSIARIRQSLTHPYVSLLWDPVAIGKPALEIKDSETREQRVKGLGYEYRLPDPTDRKEIEYYRNPKHRGYLAHTVKEGEMPSLYWKPRLANRKLDVLEALEREKKGKKVEENRVW